MQVRKARVLVAMVAAVLVAPVVLAAPASAASTFTVTTTADTNPAPVPADCTVADCTLREAIVASNADPASTIVLPATGSADPYVIADGNDELSITADVTIEGGGRDTTVVSGQDGVGPVNDTRVFSVQAGATVVMRALTVTAGRFTSSPGDVEGVGIRNAGTLTLDDVLVGGNTTDSSGAFVTFGGGVWNGGTLTITSSVLASNSIGEGGDPMGAGLYNAAGASLSMTDTIVTENETDGRGCGLANFGTATLTNVEVTDNGAVSETVCDQAGGIYNAEGGSVTMSGGRIVGNHAKSGGGLYNENATASLSGVLVSTNTATDGAGGGIVNIADPDGTASLQVSDSEVSDNDANASDEGSGAGGGLANASATPTLLTNVSILRNTANGAGGGGVANLGGYITMVGAAVADNTTSGVGGGFATLGEFGPSEVELTNVSLSGNQASQGGAVYLFSGSEVRLTQLTVSGNTAPSGAGIWNDGTVEMSFVTVATNTGDAPGGGLLANDGTFNVVGSVLASNATTNCAVTGSGAITSGGYNVDSDGSCFGSSTDPGVDPPVEEAQPPGTVVVPLQPDSPAIDVIPIELCPPPATDARGVARPQVGRAGDEALCDAGSYEYVLTGGTNETPVTLPRTGPASGDDRPLAGLAGLAILLGGALALAARRRSALQR